MLLQTSVFFSREILNEPSLTPFHVSNQLDTFCDGFKFTIIAYLRASLTAVIYVNSNYSGVHMNEIPANSSSYSLVTQTLCRNLLLLQVRKWFINKELYYKK